MTQDPQAPPPARRSGRRSEADAERTKARLVAAARELFAQRGVDAVSTREIAAATGVAHGLVRHHFGSKAGVFAAVVDAADAGFAAALGPLAGAVGSGDVAERDDFDVAAFITGFVEACAQQPDIARLLVHEGTMPGDRLDLLVRRLVAARAAVAPVSARLRASGRLPDVADEEFLFLLLMAGMVPFGLPALARELLGRPLSAQRHAEILVQALLRPPTPPRGRPARAGDD